MLLQFLAIVLVVNHIIDTIVSMTFLFGVVSISQENIYRLNCAIEICPPPPPLCFLEATVSYFHSFHPQPLGNVFHQFSILICTKLATAPIHSDAIQLSSVGIS